ncbi:MAG: DUF4147 domain-containing protein [Paracoccaceae bacterium]
MRQRAVAIFDAGVAAADPARAVLKSLDESALPAFAGRLIVISLGKGAVGMARAALSRLRADQAIIVTNTENAIEVDGATVFAAGHPVPDEVGLTAGMAVQSALQGVGKDDHVLMLISGGGSALLPAPVAGLDLADKVAVNQLLLGAGMDITAMNLVRQNLSRLKGGGFVRYADPALVTALILSDVVGDDLAVVASGPTVAPLGSGADARAALVAADIWQQMPVAVQAVLGRVQSPGVDMARVQNRLIGSNTMSVKAMAAVAPDASVYPHALDGDVSDAAGIITRCKKAGTWLFGGETTVRLAGHGRGGRNQELALRVALLAQKQGWSGDWVFLSAGTDGRDGPTDAAGGLVDGATLARMRRAGLDPAAVLVNNDSYHGLKAAGDLLITGATGTNVADLQVLIRG